MPVLAFTSDEIRDLRIGLHGLLSPDASDNDVARFVRHLEVAGWFVIRRSVIEREMARACRLAAHAIAAETHEIAERLDRAPDRDVYNGTPDLGAD